MPGQSARSIQFGQELRTERERRGLSVDALCNVTKVSRRDIEALEAGQWHELPGGVIRKGIVRSYLAAVGLEEASWMERFADHLHKAGDEESGDQDWTEFAENVRRNRSATSRPTGLRWLGVLLMILALAACSWLAWKYVFKERLTLPTRHVESTRSVP